MSSLFFIFEIYLKLNIKAIKNITALELYIYVFIFRHAAHVSIDDEVLVNENNKLVPKKVLNVSNSIMEGHYYYYFSKSKNKTLYNKLFNTQ